MELDALKRLKKEELLERRKKTIEDGCCTVETRIGSLSFWTSRDAVTDLGHYVQEVTLGAVAGQAPKDITRQWKTASGIVSLPGDVSIQAGKALADWTQEQFNHEARLGLMVEAAETPEAVQSITWETPVSVE
jgi:hypothetical protein